MNYIVMDLEWNQAISPAKKVRYPIYLSGDIIQFGAVKLAGDLSQGPQVLDTYSQIVKPTYYPKMNRDVTALTDITDEMIAKGRPFEEVCPEFLDWCGNGRGEEFAFLTWSGTDICELEDNMYIRNMDTDVLPACYDVQIMFDDQVTQEDRSFALSYAMWKFGIKPATSHDALNDSLNTVEVMRRLDLSEGFEGYEVGGSDDEEY